MYLNAGRENAVASTKAFTCQVTVLSLIAIWFSQVKPTDLCFLLIRPRKDIHEQRQDEEKDDGRFFAQVLFHPYLSVFPVLMLPPWTRLPTNVGMALRMLQKPCQQIAKKLLDSKCDHMFVLGEFSILSYICVSLYSTR